MARNEIYLHIMRKINVSFNSAACDDKFMIICMEYMIPEVLFWSQFD